MHNFYEKKNVNLKLELMKNYNIKKKKKKNLIARAKGV